jgi:hypothetical protein
LQWSQGNSKRVYKADCGIPQALTFSVRLLPMIQALGESQMRDIINRTFPDAPVVDSEQE